MKEQIYNALSELYPLGARKRALFSPTNLAGHKAIDELLAEGRISAELYQDFANMESYYIYRAKCTNSL